MRIKGLLVILNFSDEDAEISLKFNGPIDSLINPKSRKKETQNRRTYISENNSASIILAKEAFIPYFPCILFES